MADEFFLIIPILGKVIPKMELKAVLLLEKVTSDMDSGGPRVVRRNRFVTGIVDKFQPLAVVEGRVLPAL